MRGTLTALLRMSRPYYVIQAIAPPVAGYVSASQPNFSFLTAAVVAGTFGLLAMAAWAGDDLFDKDLDKRGEQKTFHGLYVAGGTGTLLAHRLPLWIVVTYMSLLIVVAIGLAATMSVLFLVLASTCGLVGIFYSLPSIRLKERGLIGAALTASSYGLVAFTAGCVAGGIQLNISVIVFGVVMSVLVFGYDGLGHIIDYIDDKANGLNTFAVQLGVTHATKLLAFCQLLPIMVLWSLGLTGLLSINLIGVTFMSVITAFTAVLLLYGRTEQNLYALRLMSVPLLSASFFLLI